MTPLTIEGGHVDSFSTLASIEKKSTWRRIKFSWMNPIHHHILYFWCTVYTSPCLSLTIVCCHLSGKNQRPKQQLFLIANWLDKKKAGILPLATGKLPRSETYSGCRFPLVAIRVRQKGAPVVNNSMPCPGLSSLFAIGRDDKFRHQVLNFVAPSWMNAASVSVKRLFVCKLSH